MKIITSKGLWVSSSFTERFGSKDIKLAKTVPSFKVLTNLMYDHEIKSELGPEECTLGDVAAFLRNPPEGTKDSYANIFYVAGFVVGVRWDAVGSVWDVSVWSLDVAGWSLDVGQWGAGRRVFSRNWILEPKPSSSDALILDTAIAMVKEAGYTVVKIV